MVRRPDHPRSRGVYQGEIKDVLYLEGSSPLARGLRRQNIHNRRPDRIIPARAGFTDLLVRGRLELRDHPRSRGVYSLNGLYTVAPTGSSPLARGLPRKKISAFRKSRIIPARAGFTDRRAHNKTIEQDHPRSRGVYSKPSSSTTGPAGSSPLARGLPAIEWCFTYLERIIPARAGFTHSHSPPSTPTTDHPRSRGVYLHGRRQDRPGCGSSPLARGLPQATACIVICVGIIPARAGFTGLRVRLSQPIADHPRSRGVYIDGEFRIE